MQPSNGGLADVKREVRTHAIVLGSALGVMWAQEVVDQVVFGARLDAFGIHPRTLWGLVGIPLAPWLHVGFGHLVANSLPFLVLGWFVMLRGVRQFFGVSLVITLLGGAAVWLLGRGNVHLGASGLIFGYLGFLLLRGWFDRTFWGVLGSLAVLGLYGGMVWGVLPSHPGVSWESHLFGFAAGVFAAWLTRSRRAPARPLRAAPIRAAR